MPNQGLPYLPRVHKISIRGNHVAFRIRWEKILPELEAHRPVNKVQVQVVQVQVTERLLAGSLHLVFLMVRAPQLKPAREHILSPALEAMFWSGAGGLEGSHSSPHDPCRHEAINGDNGDSISHYGS